MAKYFTSRLIKFYEPEASENKEISCHITEGVISGLFNTKFFTAIIHSRTCNSQCKVHCRGYLPPADILETALTQLGRIH